MTRTSLSGMNCSFARAVDRLGDKWSLMIVRDAFYGMQTFSQSNRRLGVAPTVLTNGLESLCSHGILVRHQRREGVERHSYHLTEAGRALFPVVVSLLQWGDTWISGEGHEPVCLLDKKSQSRIAKLTVISQSGHLPAPETITFASGPGLNG